MTICTRTPRNRGVALLLVMVGMVVCTLLVAGFLSTQGTSIGIAHNERDAQKGRSAAQSGIDLCYWLLQNRADWRTQMAPGTWLNNLPVGEGTVTVVAADGDGNPDFKTNPASSLLLTSTSTVNNRTFTLSTRISPTGGGSVFQAGSFSLASVTLHNTASVDSYNSSVAPYNSLLPGSNATFSTNLTSPGALTMDGLSSFRGSFLGGPNSVLGNLVNALLGLLIPTSTGAELQNYLPGQVIPPNTYGLTSFAALNANGGSGTITATPGQYPSISILTGTLSFPSGTYHVTGNFTSSSTTLLVPTGANVILEVDGTTTLYRITVQGTGTLTYYFNGPLTITSTSSVTGGTSAIKFLGLPNASTFTLKTAASLTGTVFAPQTSAYFTDSSKLFGAIIAHDLTMDKTSAFHFDEATKSIPLHNITGGSAPSAPADYTITRVGAS